MERLVGSAVELGFPPVERDRINQAITALLPHVPPEGARLRYTVTGSGRYVVELAELPEELETIRAVTASWPHNDQSPLTAHKLTSYAENVWALGQAKEAGADEALFRNTRGDYCEGAMSNLFIVIRKRLITPPLDAGILPGVTRAVVIERAQKGGIPVAEAPVSPEMMFGAQEIMVTGSVKGVVPVVELDGKTFKAGPITRRLQQLVQGRE